MADSKAIRTSQETQKELERILPKFNDLMVLGDSPFACWQITRQQAFQYPHPNTHKTLGRAVQAVIRQSIGELKAIPGSDPEIQRRDHRILTGLFCEGLTPEQIYTGILNISRSHFYRERKRATAALAAFLAERESNTQSIDRGLHTLPPAAYTRLFGVAAMSDQVLKALAQPNGPALIAIDGLGGTGKTAMGREISLAAMQASIFEALVWQTAQRHAFTGWGEITAVDTPALTSDALMNGIAAGLGIPAFNALPLAEKEKLLRQHLAGQPTLMVVDNLETAADIHALIDILSRLTQAQHTKALLTSRHRVGSMLPVKPFHVQPLSKPDTLAFVRYEAAERGNHALAQAEDEQLAPIYTVSGGNPLAIKLIVGQSGVLPLAQALKGLQAPSAANDRFYTFIYRHSWSLLSPPSKDVLLSLATLAPEGAHWDELSFVGELPDSSLNMALSELARFSLIATSAGLEMVYHLHPLTRQFILADLVGNWDMSL